MTILELPQIGDFVVKTACIALAVRTLQDKSLFPVLLLVAGIALALNSPIYNNPRLTLTGFALTTLGSSLLILQAGKTLLSFLHKKIPIK